MKEWAYIKPGHYSFYIKPHLQKVEASVNSKERELPEHCPELDDDDKEILLAEQHPSIRNVSQLPTSFFVRGSLCHSHGRRYQKKTIVFLCLSG